MICESQQFAIENLVTILWWKEEGAITLSPLLRMNLLKSLDNIRQYFDEAEILQRLDQLIDKYQTHLYENNESESDGVSQGTDTVSDHECQPAQSIRNIMKAFEELKTPEDTSALKDLTLE